MTEPSSVHILRNLTTAMKSDCTDRSIRACSEDILVEEVLY
jgi:hypothetical protein